MKPLKNAFISPSTTVRLAILVLAAGLLLSLPLRAQEERASREIEAAKKQVRLLMERAGRLEEAGRIDDARELTKKADAIKEKITRARNRFAGEDMERNRRHLEEILDGLERGMVALDKLGRGDELERLSRVADEVRRKMRRLDEENEKRMRDSDEGRAAAEEIEIMEAGLHALREKDRNDAAELLEHAIAARRARLENRRDREAEEILESEPPLPQQIEVLALAARIWDGFGHERKAEALRDLVRRMKADFDRGGMDRPRPEREEGFEAAREQERDERQQRIERLSDRIARLEKALEKFRDEIESLKREQR